MNRIFHAYVAVLCCVVGGTVRAGVGDDLQALASGEPSRVVWIEGGVRLYGAAA